MTKEYQKKNNGRLIKLSKEELLKLNQNKKGKNKGVGLIGNHIQVIHSRRYNSIKDKLFQKKAQAMSSILKINDEDKKKFMPLERNKVSEIIQIISEYIARKENSGKKDKNNKKSKIIEFGISHVTKTVQNKKAKLVLISLNLVPADVATSLPILCQELNVPFGLISSDKKLGKLINKKTATCISVLDLKDNDKDIEMVCNILSEEHNNNKEK